MTTASSAEQKVWTEAEPHALPDDGYNYEVVAGEVVIAVKHGAYHGGVCVNS